MSYTLPPQTVVTLIAIPSRTSSCSHFRILSLACQRIQRYRWCTAPRRLKLDRLRRRSHCGSRCIAQPACSPWRVRRRQRCIMTHRGNPPRGITAAIHHRRRTSDSSRRTATQTRTCRTLHIPVRHLSRHRERLPERNPVKARCDGLPRSRDRI